MTDHTLAAMDLAASFIKEQQGQIDELRTALTEIVQSIDGGGNIVTFSEADVERYRAILNKEKRS